MLEPVLLWHYYFYIGDSISMTIALGDDSVAITTTSLRPTAKHGLCDFVARLATDGRCDLLALILRIVPGTVTRRSPSLKSAAPFDAVLRAKRKHVNTPTTSCENALRPPRCEFRRAYFRVYLRDLLARRLMLTDYTSMPGVFAWPNC